MSGFLLSGQEKVFGLDIGFETLRLCELKKHSRNSVKVVGKAEHPITERFLDKDRIKNKAAIANMIKEARRKATPHSISAKGIVSALPESFVFSKTIQIPKMKPDEMKLAIPNEAAQYLPIPLEQVYIDFQVLITHPDEAKSDILIAAAPKKLVNDYVEVAKMADMKLVALETKPIAVGRAIVSRKLNTGIVILHIGTEITRISIWDKGKIRLVSTSSVGKNQIFESLSIINPKIEDISKAKINNDNRELITESLSPIIEEVLESIRYHQNRSFQPSKITQIFVCGGGALLSGIEKIVEEKTKISSKIAEPKVSTSTPVAPQFMTAFGLALRELY